MHISNSQEIQRLEKFIYERSGIIYIKTNDILILNLLFMKLHIYASVRYWEDAEVN